MRCCSSLCYIVPTCRLLLCAGILTAVLLRPCFGSDLDELPLRTEFKNCTKDVDCGLDECCTFDAKATLQGSTKIAWRCRPLGDVDQICHSLKSVHCPCKNGLRCVPKAIWYFGAGLCSEKTQS